MIVTFTKLFEMRIVANRRSDSSRRFKIFLSLSLLLCSISLISLGESEKNAISEAETNPEQNNRIKAKTMAIMAPTEGGYTVIPSNKLANWHKYESESKE